MGDHGILMSTISHLKLHLKSTNCGGQVIELHPARGGKLQDIVNNVFFIHFYGLILLLFNRRKTINRYRIVLKFSLRNRTGFFFFFIN